jgi:thiol:disulfide interchange protein DsbD
MGWVLVGMAVYFTRPVLPEALKILVPVAVALAAGLHLGWIDKNQANFKAFPWLKTIVGTACMVLAASWLTAWTLRGPGVSWQLYSEEILQQAAAQKRPVIIDFYADWCAPCRELETVTFHHPDVVRLAESEFGMIKVDVTQGGNRLHESLLKQFDVKGGCPLSSFWMPRERNKPICGWRIFYHPSCS